MFAATLVAFHLPFAFGVAWSAVAELTVLAAWIAWSALWDFLWFLLNPAYGWRRFRPGTVWWHWRWRWRLPLDYSVAVVASLVLALGGAARWWGEPRGRRPGGRAAGRTGDPSDRVRRLGRGRRPHRSRCTRPPRTPTRRPSTNATVCPSPHRRPRPRHRRVRAGAARLNPAWPLRRPTDPARATPFGRCSLRLEHGERRRRSAMSPSAAAQRERSMIVIGAGIAGLSAGCSTGGRRPRAG